MSIAVYEWQSTPQCTKDRLLQRSGADVHAAAEVAAAIVEDVRARGDAALTECAAKYDKADLSTGGLVVSQEEFFSAEAALDDDLKGAIRACSENVRRFHAAQMDRVEHRWTVEVAPGVFAGEQVTPVGRVGLYVPGGRAAYPSATYMLALPAVLAGVQHIAIATPPTPSGGVCAAVLFAARLCGVERVYKMGGAQAIAALAYGTDTVQKVDKIAGPGNPFVTAARRIVGGVVDVGMPAGPTDSLILADSSADPRITALDMLNEAEHGRDSASLMITHEADFAAAVAAVLPAAISAMPDPQRGILTHVFSQEGYGGIVVTRSPGESLDLANAYAPEHVLINTRDAENIARQIVNAGEILIGPWTPFSLGNFGVGVNQVLPTGGWARSYSATSVWDFLKRSSVAHATATGFAALAGPVARIAEYEGFPAHVAAVRGRL